MAHMLALLLGAIAAIQPPSSSAAAAAAPASPARQAGILYELWHTEAAAAMAQVKSQGLPILTTERVIRADGKTILDDVYPDGPYPSGDIYNVEPAELGFYCLYTARDPVACNKTVPPTPYFPPPKGVGDCKNVSGVAARHAALLTSK